MNPNGKASCIVCEKELVIYEATAPVVKTKDGRDCMNMTHDGVACVAHGNYGSTVFDPLHGEPNLGFVICDGCFTKKMNLMIPIVEEKK
jgi:hypothetical protein